MRCLKRKKLEFLPSFCIPVQNFRSPTKLLSGSKIEIIVSDKYPFLSPLLQFDGGHFQLSSDLVLKSLSRSLLQLGQPFQLLSFLWSAVLTSTFRTGMVETLHLKIISLKYKMNLKIQEFHATQCEFSKKTLSFL